MKQNSLFDESEVATNAEVCGHCGRLYSEHEGDDIRAGCCKICNEDRRLVGHHVSYRPEEIMPVCQCCHWRIHNEPGFHDELEPHMYENANWERSKASHERGHHVDTVAMEDEDWRLGKRIAQKRAYREE